MLGNGCAEEQATKASTVTRKSEARKIHSLDLHKSQEAEVRRDTSTCELSVPSGKLKLSELSNSIKHERQSDPFVEAQESPVKGFALDRARPESHERISFA